MTVLESIKLAIEEAAKHNSEDSMAPAAILWTDEDGSWAPALPQLRTAVNLITLGEFDETLKQGPDSYIRYELGKEQTSLPVIYLPGVNRASFRSVTEIPKFARHLLGLQYLANFWTQKSHKDWTPRAFLQSEHGGLNFDVAGDSDTKDALHLALPEVLDCDLSKLQGKKLEASDFRTLSTPDPTKELLLWINSPDLSKTWTPAQSENFRMFCKEDFGFDPVSDGPISAAQLLAYKEGTWENVWQRFCEAPARYPGIISRLEQVSPEEVDMFMDLSSWPSLNKKAENQLCEALKLLNKLPFEQASSRAIELQRDHEARINWVWATLGKSPMAHAIQALGNIAHLSQKNYHLDSWSQLQDYFVSTGHQIDGFMLSALKQANDRQTTLAIHNAIEALYSPWLESLARHVQTMDKSYPVLSRDQHRSFDVKAGTCLLFVDGLRFDLGAQLHSQLQKTFKEVELTNDWAALPSITSTAKPAWYPISKELSGYSSNAEFNPSTHDQKELSTYRFRKLLEMQDIEIIPQSELGDPKKAAWTECANIDSLGHKEGWKLVRHLDNQIKMIVERVIELLEAGWQKVEILTDHGWLLSPKGLAQEQLPSHLTESKWGRSALASPDAKHDLKTVPWTWLPAQEVVIPSGARAFRKREYAHGGLSLQECCIPRLTITSNSTGRASIPSIQIERSTWVGLRFKATLSNASGLICDIRTKPNAPETSLLVAPSTGSSHLVKANNTVSLLIEDDSYQGAAAIFIISTKQGEVIFKQSVTISE